MDKDFKRVMGFFFLIKSFMCLVMVLLIIYYWGVSDNIAFFFETKNFVRLVKTDISNLGYFFASADQYNEKIRLDNVLSAAINSNGMESNFLVTKFMTILYPLAFGRYLIINFLFSVIANIGQLKLYYVLTTRYPHIKRGIAIGVLFMPSILMHSSYISKETLCVGFIGFTVYNCYQLINKKHRALNLIALLFNILMIGILKVYVLFTFIAALFIVFLIKAIVQLWKGSVISKGATVFFLGIGLFFFFSNLDFFDPYIIKFANSSNTFQEQYQAVDESSSFEFGHLETSFSGLLQNIPSGIYTTYFRPQLWEVTKPIILFNALESFFVFALTLYAVISRRKYFFQLTRTDIVANLSLWFVLIFGIIVGLSTFNFGTLIRYKIPAIPFLILFVFLLLGFERGKNGITRQAAKSS